MVPKASPPVSIWQVGSTVRLTSMVVLAGMVMEAGVTPAPKLMVLGTASVFWKNTDQVELGSVV